MPQYSTSHRNNAMADLISQAGIAAFILLYSGALPASCAAADSGALLSAIPCNPVIGTVNNGVLTFNGTATAAPASASNPLGPAPNLRKYRILASSCATKDNDAPTGMKVIGKVTRSELS